MKELIEKPIIAISQECVLLGIEYEDIKPLSGHIADVLKKAGYVKLEYVCGIDMAKEGTESKSVMQKWVSVERMREMLNEILLMVKSLRSDGSLRSDLIRYVDGIIKELSEPKGA